MRIERMRAVFGVLDGAELEFTPGLNIIRAPNESGKSTWCAFILAMLYGVPSSERARAGYLPDKTRYSPWSGAMMEGSMSIVHRGRSITLQREGTVPMRNFTARLSETSEPIPELNSNNAGEILTGAKRAVFERSAFIRQSGLQITAAPELEERLAAIVTTGEDDVSFSDVSERLRRRQRALRYQSRGEIPNLEREYERLADLLREIQDGSQRRELMNRTLTQAESERDGLRSRLEQMRSERRRESLRRLSEARAELQAREAACRRAEADLSDFTAAIANSAYPETEPDGKNVLSWHVPVAGLALASAAAGVAGFTVSRMYWIPALALALGAWQLRRYLIRRDAGILEAQALWKLRREAEAAAETARSELRRAEELRARLDEELLSELDFTDESTEGGQLTRLLNSAEAELRRIRDENSRLQGRDDALGDPGAIRVAMLENEEQRRSLGGVYDAISLALEVLEESSLEISSQFSPALARLASDYFLRLSGGRYSELSFARDFTTDVRRESDTVQRSALYLSAGAADQAHLALRLAIAELALPSDEPCPIILDDPLANFDDERETLALELFSELAERRQIILFTSRGYTFS